MRLQTISLKRARRMRQALAPPELALWAALKGRQLGGYAFRRQHPVWTALATLRLTRPGTMRVETNS